MIYTIGYHKNSLNDVVKVMAQKEIDLLVDVRSHPYSRNPAKQEFNKNRLLIVLGGNYTWVGDMCGGLKGVVKEKCLKWIIEKAKTQTLLLMCMENHPCECHRFYDIAKRLAKVGISATHIFDGHEKTTEEITEVIKNEGRNKHI